MSDFISRIFKAIFFLFCIIRLGNLAPLGNASQGNNTRAIQGLNSNLQPDLFEFLNRSSLDLNLPQIEKNGGNVFHNRHLLQMFKPTIDGTIFQSITLPSDKEPSMTPEKINKILKDNKIPEQDIREFMIFLRDFKFKRNGEKRAKEEQLDFLEDYSNAAPEDLQKFMKMGDLLNKEKKPKTKTSSCVIS